MNETKGASQVNDPGNVVAGLSLAEEYLAQAYDSVQGRSDLQEEVGAAHSIVKFLLIRVKQAEGRDFPQVHP